MIKEKSKRSKEVEKKELPFVQPYPNLVAMNALLSSSLIPLSLSTLHGPGASAKFRTQTGGDDVLPRTELISISATITAIAIFMF